MTKIRIKILLILLLGILFSGCVTDQSSSIKNSKTVSEQDAWYNLGDLVTPGYYADKLSKDLKSGSVNDILDMNPVDALKSLIPGYEENAFKGSIENLLRSWDSSVSADTIEGFLLIAQSECADPNVKLSDTGEIMRLPGALKHFGDLYGNNNPDTKPTIEDLENAKKKVKCYNYQFSNTNTKETPERRYLIDLTSDIEKLIDFKINNRKSGLEQKSADSVQNQQGGEPKSTATPVGAVVGEKLPVIDGRDWNTAKKIVKQTEKYSVMVARDPDKDYAFLIQGELPEVISIQVDNDFQGPYAFRVFKNGTTQPFGSYGGPFKVTKFNQQNMQIELEGAGKVTSSGSEISIEEKIDTDWEEVIKIPASEILKTVWN